MIFASGLVGAMGLVFACSDDGSEGNTSVAITLGDTLGSADDDIDSGDENETTEEGSTGPLLDMEDTTTSGTPGCAAGDSTCNQIDLLFVIDNSGTMGEEQVNLSANFPLLVQKLQDLQDSEGNPLTPDVNIMVTTTDLGHPQCTAFQPDGYEPAQGSPVDTPCIDRLDDFTGLGSNPPSFPEACTSGCPVSLKPSDSFIHFEGDNTNVPGNDVEGALSCIGPQGVVGCGYEAPLEAMLQALNPGAQWNQGTKPFLRDGATLAVVVITDEADCSVRSPDGYAYFTSADLDTYWEINPDTQTKSQATSAVCWNAGVDCGTPDANGVYADCTSIDTGVLHPLSRYLTYLQDELIASQNKEVIMLGILGVPPVTAHNESPPFEPTEGGVESLVYRQWVDGAYPDGDILPEDIADEVSAAQKEFEFGIGPGCTGEDGMGGFTGQAVPPVRVKEVCEALNEDDKIRCCIESVCDSDFSDAINCLTGIIQDSIAPIG
ncbi:hypothetical protein G6O69_22015 [Pseudenhygromyxa sp. WMMC2535]|uniref:hypothetical protein n=1 Tax=Pseudenhygromyxa sp. WMMC2535 TaxID=2712867 RepID=UPI00159610F2|nr:hypothetical protein [Pseudenhygromyxa sp. WMMC2535]NVB40533.1 hypothetical protein [Pseudenhygromyxa sp. WMMC2535]